MHLFVLLVVATVLAWDSGLRPFGDAGLIGAPWVGVTVAAALPAFAFLVGAAACRPSRDGRVSAATLRRTDRLLRAAPWFALATHAAAVLCLGWITAIRHTVGDLVLVDELIAIAPPLLAVVALWWTTWPIERRVQEVSLLNRLDAGDFAPRSSGESWVPALLPVSLPGRAATVWHQVRAQLLLVLVPVLVALGLSEAVSTLIRHFRPAWSDEAQAWVPLIAVGSALVAAPLCVRIALGLRPLPAGELRDSLMEVCAVHRVRIREILVWSTGGLMLNGAVIGLIGRVRYILLTDAIIDRLPRRLLLAVMAHEIGHIRRHHLPWLGAAALASLWIASALAWSLRSAAERVLLDAKWISLDDVAGMAMAVEVFLAVAVAVGMIGWVSRRLEWQADAFAAVHVNDRAPLLTSVSVETVCDALETVTRASGGDPRSRSWRHGSIRQRQHHLRGLAGMPTTRLPIDRRVRLLKVVVGAIVVVAIGSLAWPLPASPPPSSPVDVDGLAPWSRAGESATGTLELPFTPPGVPA